MKVVCSIEARMKSSRLPGKVLKEVCGKPILLHIVDRVKRSKKIDDIVVATTTSPEDDKIADLCRENNINFYRGSEEDVLGRLAACHNFMDTGLIVEITGDSPFADPNLIDETVSTYLDTGADYVSNTLVRTHPIGIRSQVFSRRLLQEVNNLVTLQKDREHVTTFICRNEESKYKLVNVESSSKHRLPKLRLTLDYPEDLEVTKIIYNALYLKNKNFSLDDIVEFLDTNPEVVNINKNCKQIYKEGA
jgi:spore coat polysaccharide biosynthesis protein SpsF (cytidylyltransferase family)